MNIFVDRMVRAARLDANLYEEVEADKNTMGQATLVVVLASVAAGVGHFATSGAAYMLVLIIGALLGWYIWAFLTYFIGTRLLPEPQTKADLGELLRTVGFASAPGIIRVFGIIPLLTAVIYLIAALWMLAAMIVAVRQALDYTSTWRAIAVCVIGWVIQGVVLTVIILALGGDATPM